MMRVGRKRKVNRAVKSQVERIC